MSANENNIVTNLNDLSGLKKKLEIKIKHDLCILNAGKIFETAGIKVIHKCTSVRHALKAALGAIFHPTTPLPN